MQYLRYILVLSISLCLGVFLGIENAPKQAAFNTDASRYLLQNEHDLVRIASWLTPEAMADIVANSHQRHEIVVPSPLMSDLGDMESESEEQSNSEDEDGQHTSLFVLRSPIVKFGLTQHVNLSFYNDVSPIVAVNYLYILFHALIFYD